MSYLIGNKIKELRKNKGLTQEDLAKKIGVSLISIQRWENNQYSPSFNDLYKILKILNASLHDIMSIEDKKKCQIIKSTQKIIQVSDDSLLFAGIKKNDKLIIDTLINSFNSLNENSLFAIKANNKISIGIPKITPGGVLILHAGDPHKNKIEIFPKSKIEILGKAIKLIRIFQ